MRETLNTMFAIRRDLLVKDALGAASLLVLLVGGLWLPALV